ncbi:CopG family transcriptional regulator [Cellulosimicrobium protaetiae]|uniref:CopG family transcriptional regulator n=1 Tax=Cellulosimicrobium protaetiae TaxID=2587808 RepID=A0A6M5UI45_9MICO|nr:CopG family transcriptional regulator [Cellulosimicrobium protaetiae]QJW36921.1 CopG family transcriptional regulator [Cellulosimicrobium protaetiae]
MAMTLRLDDDAQAALERIAHREGISANTAVARAVVEYDAKRREMRDRMLADIVAEDRELLDRLAQ